MFLKKVNIDNLVGHVILSKFSMSSQFALHAIVGANQGFGDLCFIRLKLIRRDLLRPNNQGCTVPVMNFKTMFNFKTLLLL